MLGIGSWGTGSVPGPTHPETIGPVSHDGGVSPRDRSVLTGSALLTAACVLAACGNSSSPPPATSTTTTMSSTTTTTVAPPPTTAPAQGVAVPNVVGMKIQLARFYLRTAGFSTVPFNAACSKGTLASQSVVAALSVPGKPPNVTVGAQPLVPGTLLPKGTRVGITWSGCYPEGTEVPLVIGSTFHNAVHLLHLAGLEWACFSDAPPTTTTTTHAATTTAVAPTAVTTSTTTTAPRTPNTVLSQGTPAGTVVHAGSVIDLVMHHCPQ